MARVGVERKVGPLRPIIMITADRIMIRLAYQEFKDIVTR